MAGRESVVENFPSPDSRLSGFHTFLRSPSEKEGLIAGFMVIKGFEAYFFN